MISWGSPVHPDCERQEQAIRENDLAAVCTAAGNALEHCSGAVETAAICKQLNAQGAITSLMTGSGAAVFGVFDDGQKAKQAQQALQAGYDQVYLARPVRGGARVLPRPLPKRTTHPGGKNKPAGCRSAACDLPIAFVSLILCLLWFIKPI